jgi:hypothetical protein
MIAPPIAVSGGVLGEAVQKDVDVEASVVVKARKRIVHHGETTAAPRMARQVLDVRDLGHRVRRAFEQDQPCFGLVEDTLDACVILDRQQIVGHTVAGEQMLHEIAGGSVGFDESKDMVALLAERQGRGGNGRDPGSDQETVLPALQPRKGQLELPKRRIRSARIIKPGTVSFEIAQGFLGVVERELHRLIYRRHQRPIVRRQLGRRRMVDERVVFHRATIVEATAH